MKILQLPGYSDKVCDVLYQSFKSSSNICDVSVTTSDRVTFKTHKVILATFSQYFVTQFQNRKKITTLSIGVDSKCLQCLLEFMYTGELKVTEENRSSLYQAAVSLNMPDVQDLLLHSISASFLSQLNTGHSGLSLFVENSKQEDTFKIKQEVVDPCLSGNSQSASSSYNVPQEQVSFENDQSEDNFESDGNDYESDPDFTPKKTKKTPAKKLRPSLDKKTPQKRSRKSKVSSASKRKPKTNSTLKTPQKKVELVKKFKNVIKTKPASSGTIKCHCGVCGTSYVSYTTLKRHMLVKHNSVTPDFYQNRLLFKWYQIQIRNRRFVSKSLREKTEHSQKRQAENYCCKKCGKCFKNYCLLCAHVMKKHATVCRTKSRKDVYHSRITYILAKKQNFIQREKYSKAGKSRTRDVGAKKTSSSNKQKLKVRCVLCDAEISCLRHLTNHMIRVHSFSSEKAKNITGYPKSTYKIPSHCPNCDISFPTRKALTLHLRNHHKTVEKSEDLSCTECAEKCKSILALKTHLKNVHQKSYTGIRESLGQSVPCEVTGCEFSSGNLSVLNKHMMASHPEVEHKCSECGYTFHIKSQRDKHYLFKHKNRDENQRHHCSVCEKKFSKPYYLNKHQFMVHGIDHPNIKRYNCEVEGCDYISVCSTGLRQHMHSKHSNKEKNFQCDHCGMKLRSKLTLRKHISKIHLNIRPHMCHICGMKFGEEPELMAHITNRHTEEKQFQCEYCSYQTSNKCTFKTHMFLIHKVRAENDSRPEFKCPKCDFVTVLKSRYKSHFNSHENIRNYGCKLCPKKFISSSTLQAHIQWTHSEAKVVCPHCEYRTKTSQKLSEHIRVQHQLKGIKPYKCPYCEFTCATGGNCRKHIKSRHKGQEVRYIRDDDILAAAKFAQQAGTDVSLVVEMPEVQKN